MFNKQGEIDGKLQGSTDAKNNLPAIPRPNLKYALFSNSYLKSFMKSYYMAHQKAEYDKDYLRRQTLMKDRAKVSRNDKDRDTR